MRPEGAKFATIQDGVVSGFGLDEATKRVLDVVAATMGLTLFAPILLIISIAVKLGSRGPIFIQTKYRYDNRAMEILGIFWRAGPAGAQA
jgi:lipopolysaccharide/colanic/teichoic acid biosynthesis glycosyltransferase